ncbi:hypothetical protein [Nonomuraea lactucae]|uniref:hypothetical protein n=1 Tax=Nonomuraea lactucae TaxID=2249762 RepID=UPI000DE574C5|nr:hypothetical protein [Nonomuraea lactucae]
MVHVDESANQDKTREALSRGWRTFLQSIAAVAVVAAGEAVVGSGSSDLRQLAVAGGTAALAAVLSWLHNVVAPQK